MRSIYSRRSLLIRKFGICRDERIQPYRRCAAIKGQSSSYAPRLRGAAPAPCPNDSCAIVPSSSPPTLQPSLPVVVPTVRNRGGRPTGTGQQRSKVGELVVDPQRQQRHGPKACFPAPSQGWDTIVRPVGRIWNREDSTAASAPAIRRWKSRTKKTPVRVFMIMICTFSFSKLQKERTVCGIRRCRSRMKWSSSS
jgi:hypothetical protein